jgi:hypothetical protein
MNGHQAGIGIHVARDKKILIFDWTAAVSIFWAFRR